MTGEDRIFGRTLMKSPLIAIALAALALVACQPQNKAGQVDAKRLIAADGNGEWLSYGKGYSEQRFSPLDKVNATNVGQLGLAWYVQFDTDRGQEATPLMVDGVLYTTTNWSKVYAFDAKTGKALWNFDPKIDKSKGFDACCDTVNRGVAVWNGKLFVGTIDGRLIALDAATGKQVWSTQTTPVGKTYTITGAPRVAKGKVFIGNSGAEYDVRGYISAYDAETGKLDWRFYTIPNPTGAPDGAASDEVLAGKAAATWFGDGWKKTGGGGTVWDAITYDAESNLVYFGTGNGTPWNRKLRSDGKGDNLFLSSIVAVNADTGKYAWHFQETPGEEWDYDSDQQIVLADLTLDGKARKVIMHAPKSGFLYVLDRTNGELISAKPYSAVTWATNIDPATGRPVESQNARYVDKPVVANPQPLGVHNWQPIAFNPKEALLYIPTSTSTFAYGIDKNYQYLPGMWNIGVDPNLNELPADRSTWAGIAATTGGALIAWDPVAQKQRWSAPHRYFWNGGVLATGGGLVFEGAAEGDFSAYGAADGKKLWTHEAGAGIIAAPMTYEVGGEQYVAIMVGSGGGGQISAPVLMPARPRLPGRLLVFKIGGKATAPAFEIPVVPPLDLTGVTAKGDPKIGELLFNGFCNVCHGSRASGVWLPDLTKTPILLTEADFKSVVIDGVKGAQGMAGFKRFITPVQAEDLRAYLISEARGAAPKVAGAVATGSGKK
jgi:quinohemoprotein ethanol dehydrogenase